MNKSIIILLLSVLLSAMSIPAQVLFDGKKAAVDNLTGTWLITVPKTVYGTNYTAAVTLDESVTKCTIDGVRVYDSYTFNNVRPSASYKLVVVTGQKTIEANIKFSYWPLIQIYGEYEKRPYHDGTVTITIPDSNSQETIYSRVRWAGSSTARPEREKRNFQLKFYTDESRTKACEKDMSFFGLRKDFHWRLDAGQIDFARVRNRVSKDIWADFASAPYYAPYEPKTPRSYVRGDFVEVFLNDEYMGIYSLNEHMDRQQLKLMKYDYENGVFHGGLWKPMSWSDVTTFNTLPSYVNVNQGWWDNFYVKYPNIDNVKPTNYQTLYDAIKFTLNASDRDFLDSAKYYFDIPVFRDYYLFTILLQAPDNIGKNLYYACYDIQTDKRLTIAIWDLDCTQGQYWSNSVSWYHCPDVGPEVDFRDDKFIRGHRVFKRLMDLDPSFHGLATERYWELRNTVFHPDSIKARYEVYFNEMKGCGADQREITRWTGNKEDLGKKPLNFDTELQYLRDWWDLHIAFLDNSVFIPYPMGDVNFDRSVDINDVVLMVDYLLGRKEQELNIKRVDFNHNQDIDLGDIASLIDILLDTTIPTTDSHPSITP